MKGGSHEYRGEGFTFIGGIGGSCDAKLGASSRPSQQRYAKRRIHAWSHPYVGFELPLSGPGPVRNRSRLRTGPQAGVGDGRQLVGDYTNPILKPQAAQIVKQHGEISVTA
jgi:hypothetical protein